MKGNFKFGMGLLLVVILTIALIQASQKEPINWSKTFNPKDKIPFGTYVVKHELKHIFDKNQQIHPIQSSIYSYLEDSINNHTAKDLIYIGRNFRPGKTSISALLSFVKNGNNALVSTSSFQRLLMDTLKISMTRFSYLQAGKTYAPDSFRYVLPAGNFTVKYDKIVGHHFFNKLDSSTTTILGYWKRDELSLPNFIKVTFGSGSFYLQLTPGVFSNYYMLDKDTYAIAYASLLHLKGKYILWKDSYANDVQSRTPLRYILRQPALRAAWYLLLVTLLLFLIFKSKREQAAVPILTPEENLSVAFAETIGSLYYENGSPGNMIVKKINYFLYYLKKNYRLQNTNIEERYFRKQMVHLLKLSEEEIDMFFDQLMYYKELKETNIKDLKKVQNLIEDFKSKIQ